MAHRSSWIVAAGSLAALLLPAAHGSTSDVDSRQMQLYLAHAVAKFQKVLRVFGGEARAQTVRVMCVCVCVLFPWSVN